MLMCWLPESIYVYYVPLRQTKDVEMYAILVRSRSSGAIEGMGSIKQWISDLPIYVGSKCIQRLFGGMYGHLPTVLHKDY